MNELRRYYLDQKRTEAGASERTLHMTLLEAYLSNRQYECLPRAWDESVDPTTAQPIPFRLRRPSVVLPLPALGVDTHVRGLWGAGRRPIATLKGAPGPEDNALLADLITEAQLYRVMRDATRKALTVGTGVVAWRIVDGFVRADALDAKHCTPTFQPGRFPELARLEIRFPHTVEEDGAAITRWHREVIDATKWTVYQDVEVTADRKPEWREDTALSVEHKLGFVPAVWFIVGDRSGPWDGTGIFAEILALLDDANFTSSQAARALHYNLDPQTVITGAKVEEVDELRKSGATAWTLPLGADAKLLESNGEYIKSAETRLESLRKSILDAMAIVINDPERVKGAQSGSALELLSAPMLARTADLREDVGECAFRPLLEQIARVRLGKPARVLLHWGALSPTTTDDAKTASEAADKAVEKRLVSRAMAARWVAPYFGVADVERDQLQVDTERLEKERLLDEALAVSQIPSGRFQGLHAKLVAARVLGPDATPEALAHIAREVELNRTHDDFGSPVRRSIQPVVRPAETEGAGDEGATSTTDEVTDE